MNILEDRLRAALRARAQESPIDPGAWEQTVARSRLRLTTRLGSRSWPARFVIPAAAAAAVTGIIVASAMTMSGITGRPGGPAGPPSGTATASAVPHRPTHVRPTAPGPSDGMFQNTPPDTAIVKISQGGDSKARTYFWFGHERDSPSSGTLNSRLGVFLCDETFTATGGSGGQCAPAPQLGTGQVARYVNSDNLSGGAALKGRTGPSSVTELGLAAIPVTSVTAVLPDGRSVPGRIITGRGFPDQVWLVNRTPGQAVTLVFRDAAGQVLVSLYEQGSAPPAGRPSSGGVLMFHYPTGNSANPVGSTYAYLINGRVAFWSSYITTGFADDPARSTESIFPESASGGPTLAGLISLVGDVNASSRTAECMGYAHADVSRVVLRMVDGTEYSGSTFAAGWPGTDVRLWEVRLSEAESSKALLGTATAYDATGHVIAKEPIGTLATG
jgi:hypothetical protein